MERQRIWRLVLSVIVEKLKTNVCFFEGWKSRDSVPILVKQYMDGKLKVDEFVTQNFGLNQINESFELMHHGKSLRAIINF